MFQDGILKITEKNDLANAWDAIFKNFNEKKLGKKKGYTKGEKVFIKINQGQANWVVSRGSWENDTINGYKLSHFKS